MKRWIIGVLAAVLALTVTLAIIVKNRRDEAAANESTYNKAEAFWAAGDIQNAYLTFSEIRDYSNASEKMQQLEAQDSRLSLLLANVGDTVCFGHYEQDNNADNGAEPIEWVVLYKNGESLYLFSKNVLDVMPFSRENIYDCSLDKWLKSEFLKAAFEDLERDAVSRVCLLHENDITQYNMGSELLSTTFSPAALAKNPQKSYDAKQLWWMMTDYLQQSNYTLDVLGRCAEESGRYKEAAHGIDMYASVTSPLGVRPAIWVFTEPNELPNEPVFSGKAPEIVEIPNNNSSGGNYNEKCSVCGGLGSVRYYYGSCALEAWLDGYEDFYMGPCPSCDGTGH